MANPRAAWGIDIGNRALKAIKLVRDANGQLQVQDFEVIEHETPLSSAGDNRDALIRTALTNFVQRHPEKRNFVGVSVSGSSSLARFIKLPPVEPKKVLEIVRFEAIQQIPFPLDDVEWSHQLFQSPDSPDVEVGIFAMRKELINHHLKFFTDVGLNVEVVQLNPLAVYNAMVHDQRLDGATMIIDLGSENTDLIIADGQTIWLRSVPVGGKSFTEVLVKQFKLNFAKAEELKRTAATSKYAKQIFQAMRPVFADLVAEVQRSIGFYASVHRDSRLKKVLALGGTFRLPGLQKYLQQNLQLDVARIDHLTAGAPAESKKRAVFEENLLSLTSAYGLAIQVMGDAKISSSLLPQSIRREKMWKDKAPWFAAAAACFVAGAGVAMGTYFVQNLQYGQNAAVRSHVTDIVSRGNDLDGQWSTNVEQDGAGDRLRIGNVQGMLVDRDLWQGILDDVYSALPRPKNPVLLGGDWDQIKAKTKRTERDILRIDSVASVYDTDLSKTYAGAAPASADSSTPAPTGLTILPGLGANVLPAGGHGFRLTLNVVTPYGGNVVDALKFAEATIIPNLRALQNKESLAHEKYSLVYAEVTRRQLVGEDQDYRTRLQGRISNWANSGQLASGTFTGSAVVSAPTESGGEPMQIARPMAGFGGGGFGHHAGGGPHGMPGGFGGMPQPYAPPQDNSAPANPGEPSLPAGVFMDPLTNEDMANDTVLEITALVLVNPPAAPAAGSAPQASVDTSTAR